MTRASTAPGIGVGFSVAGALAAFDDDRLTRLLHTRPDVTVPPPRDLAQLAARLDNQVSAVACLRQLNQTDRQVLEALCLLPQPTTTPRLAALLGGGVAPEELDEPLERLADRALAFRHGENVRLLPAVEHLNAPARLGPPLAEVLGRRTTAQITEVARRIGVRPRSPKAALLDAVVEVLADAGRVPALLAEAPAGTAELAGRLASETPWVSGPDLYSQLHYTRTAETPTVWMVRTGMLVPTDWDRAVMPREVGLALRGGRPFPDFAVQPPPLAAASVDEGEVDRVAATRALRVVADVAALLEEWGERPATLLKSGGLGVRELRRAASALDRPETETARIIELAAAAGLVAEQADAGLIMPSTDCDGWLALLLPGRWARLVGAWLDAELHLALDGAGHDGKPVPPLRRDPEPDAAARRRLVLDTLAGVEPGHAPDSDGLQRRVVWQAPELWEGGPAPQATLTRSVLDEAELLGLCATGTLSTAGRLTAAGAAEDAAAALARWVPEVTTTFVVQADLTAVAAGDLDDTVRRELELLADVESKGAATVFRFSEASVRRAFDAGHSAAEIEAFLDGHAARGVPQPLRYLVADMGRRHGRVRIGTAASYLRCDDPALLAEILRAKKTAPLRLRQLAPAVLVSDADPETLLTTLRKAGYLPVRESADGAVVTVREGPHRAVAPPPPRHAVHQAFRQDPAIAALLCAHPELVDRLGLRAAQDDVRPHDPAELAARLRRAPVPPARSAPADDPLAVIRDNVVMLFPPDTELDEPATRPAGIAYGPDSVRMLLAWACDEEWLVRIAVADRTGGTTETYASPFEVARSHVIAGCPPRWDTRSFALDAIIWARVTTEAEEDKLL